MALLGLLRLTGWDVIDTVTLGGSSHLVIARGCFGDQVSAQGDSFAEAAIKVFAECVELEQRARYAA